MTGPEPGLCQSCTTWKKKFSIPLNIKHMAKEIVQFQFHRNPGWPVEQGHICPHGHQRLPQQLQFRWIHNSWNRTVPILLTPEVDEVGTWSKMIQLINMCHIISGPMESCWQEASSLMQSSVVMCSLVISSRTPQRMSTTYVEGCLSLFVFLCVCLCSEPGTRFRSVLCSILGFGGRRTPSRCSSPSACPWRLNLWIFGQPGVILCCRVILWSHMQGMKLK